MNNSYNKSEEAKKLRQKAEELAKEKNYNSKLELSEIDNLKLIHELEVHQIELEMQNEELIAAKVAADESADKYTELFDFAPSGYFLLTETGDIIALNLSASKLLGHDRSYLIDKNFKLFISRETISDFNSFIDRVFKSKTKENCDLSIETEDKQLIYLHVEGIVQNEGKSCMINAVDYTDKKKMEEALKESTERYELAIFGARDGVFDWNLITNEIYYSPVWKSMLGYTENELPNDFSVWEKLTDAEDVKRTWEMQQKLISKQIDRFEIEFKMKHKDGHWVDVLSRAEVVFDKNGKAIRIIGTHVDITERKKMEETIKTSEEKYKSLYKNAPLSYQSLNKDGIFIDVNPKWLKTLGYEKEEVIGKNYGDFLHPDWIPHFEKNFPEFKRLGQISDVQFKIRHKEGHYLDISFEGYIGNYPDGSFKQTYCVFKDITEEKKAKIKLEVSENKLSTILNSMVDGVYIVNSNLDLEYVNPVLKKEIGEISGRKCHDYFHKSAIKCSFCQIDKVLNGKTEQIVWESSINNKVYDLIDSPLKNPDGSISKLGIFRDITRLKKIEFELEQHQEHLENIVEERTKELEEKNAELKRFNKLFINREFRIKELRDELKKYKK